MRFPGVETHPVGRSLRIEAIDGPEGVEAVVTVPVAVPDDSLAEVVDVAVADLFDEGAAGAAQQDRVGHGDLRRQQMQVRSGWRPAGTVRFASRRSRGGDRLAAVRRLCGILAPPTARAAVRWSPAGRCPKRGGRAEGLRRGEMSLRPGRCNRPVRSPRREAQRGRRRRWPPRRRAPPARAQRPRPADTPQLLGGVGDGKDAPLQSDDLIAPGLDQRPVVGGDLAGNVQLQGHVDQRQPAARGRDHAARTLDRIGVRRTEDDCRPIALAGADRHAKVGQSDGLFLALAVEAEFDHVAALRRAARLAREANSLSPWGRRATISMPDRFVAASPAGLCRGSSIVGPMAGDILPPYRPSSASSLKPGSGGRPPRGPFQANSPLPPPGVGEPGPTRVFSRLGQRTAVRQAQCSRANARIPV